MPRLMLENFELVAVVAVEPILRTKPHEALIVLDNLQHSCLGEPVCRGEPRNMKTFSVDDGQSHCVRVHLSLRYSRCQGLSFGALSHPACADRQQHDKLHPEP